MFSQATADEICHRLAEGQSLRQICVGSEFPHRVTILRWLEENPDFAAKYARAREAQGDYMDDLILSTANECRPETAAADRVKIDAYKWRAAKLRPKVYGDKIETVLSGEVGIRKIERVITRNPAD